MLIKIAEIFEVSVSELLGVKIEPESDVNSVAEQLSRINEQFAIKNRRSRRFWKVIIGVIIAIVVINIFFVIVGIISFHTYGNNKKAGVTTQTQIAAPNK